MRHRITVEHAVEVNDFGAITLTWTALFTTWAKITPKTVKESMASAGLIVETLVEISLRYREGLTTDKHRVVHKGKTYDIKGIINVDQADKELILTGREVI